MVMRIKLNLTFNFVFRTEQKRIGKKRKKKRNTKKRGDDRFQTSFTSFDAFGCILDRWVDQAILLGAKDTLRFVAAQLWFNYMKHAGVAFKKGNKMESLSKNPSYRDVQVAITGRRRLIPADILGKIQKAKMKKNIKEVIDDSDTNDEDEFARKRRQKQRRKFLKTLNQDDSRSNIGGNTSFTTGDDSDEGEDDCSTLSTNSMTPSSSKSSSFYNADDSFGLSLSSFNASMHNESQTSVLENEDNSSQGKHTSSGASNTDSDTSCVSFDGSRNMEDKNIDVHIEILGKTNFKEIRRTKHLGRDWHKSTNEMATYANPSLKLVFSLVCLAVLLNEDNCITLSDLLFWAHCGTISYKTSVLGIPQDMRLSGRADRTTFLPYKNAIPPSKSIRRTIYLLGRFLNLGEVNFASSKKIPQILEIISRYVRELSLPITIVDSIEKNLGMLVLKGFKFCFKSPKESNKSKYGAPELKTEMFPSMDIYCMALILFVLKFDFGLDDRTEIKISSITMRENEKLITNSITDRRYFVFSEWLELSKRRAYLAVRYCYHLHKRYSLSLIPEVECSLPSMVRLIEDASNRAQLIKLHLSTVRRQKDSESATDLDDTYSSNHSLSNHSSSNLSEHSIASDTDQEGSAPQWYRERENDIKNVSEFIRKEFKSGCNLKSEYNSDNKFETPSIKNTLDLSTSNTPLHDFSVKQIEYNNYNCDTSFQNEDKVRLDDAEKIQALLNNYDQKVLCPLDILNKSDEYEDISRLQEDNASDFILLPLENPSRKENYISGLDRLVSAEANSAENKINLTKTILSSSESRLPVPHANSNVNDKVLFLNRKYWMCHPGSRLNKDFNNLNMIGKDGVPKSIYKGFFRYVHKLLFVNPKLARF